MDTAAIDIQWALKQWFGFESFRPGQQEVVAALLNGQSAAAIFPTGSGKSLCYQLPALLLDGLTLVVSPLIALMKDQIDALKQRGVEAERLDSSLAEDAYRDVVNRIRSGHLKLLFVAPERLSNERFLGMIRGQKLSLLAVDEAHCISAWGHNFRPDYLKLARAAKTLRVERVLALTATATPNVAKDMAAAFGIHPDNVVNTGFHRPNLEMRVTACRDEQRRALLVERLKSRPAGPAIVYVSLQRHAEEVAAHLAAHGFNARPYHAGLASQERADTQDRFMAGGVDIVCATIAFGMGIDKADIRYIYHYHLPKGFESYLQETGRAGRDGLASICELFACADDCTILENFVYGDTPDDISIVGMVNELLDQGDEIDISSYELSRRFDMRTLVVNTLLTRLELAGVIHSEGFYYGDIRFKPSCSSAEMLARYEPKQAAFLRKMFSCCTKNKTWFTLDIERAAAATGHDRATVLRAINDLERRGLVQLQTTRYRQRFRRLQAQVDREALCRQLSQAFHEHERLEIERIERMLAYAEESRCLTGCLLDYFGEPIGQCGHCGLCLGAQPARLHQRLTVPMDQIQVDGLAPLARAYPEALGRPRQRARFLCGLNSPAVSAVRTLRSHPLFGCADRTPFAEVYRWCKTLS